jgi:hypothetical protein
MKLTVHVEGKTTAEIGKELSSIAAAIGGASAVTTKAGKTSKKKEEEETFGEEDDDTDGVEASDDSDEDTDTDSDEDDSDDAAEEATHEQLVAAFSKYAKKTSKDKAIAKLNKLGYKALTKVPAAKRQSVIDAVSGK